MNNTTTPAAGAIGSSDWLGLPALSIRQPWAHLILHCGKDIENRTWPTKFRGRVLIHASKGCTQMEYESARMFTITDIPEEIEFPPFDVMVRGGIIGEVEIVDCVRESKSPWFCGPYGFVLRNPKWLQFHPCRGALGFFRPNNEVSERRPLTQTETPAMPGASLH